MKTNYTKIGRDISIYFEDLFNNVADILTDISSDDLKLINKEGSIYSSLINKDKTFLVLTYEEAMNYLYDSNDKYYTYSEDGKLIESLEKNTISGVEVAKNVIRYINMSILFKDKSSYKKELITPAFGSMNNLLKILVNYVEFNRSEAEESRNSFNSADSFIRFKLSKLSDYELQVFDYYCETIRTQINIFLKNESYSVKDELLKKYHIDINICKHIVFILNETEKELGTRNNKERIRIDNYLA